MKQMAITFMVPIVSHRIKQSPTTALLVKGFPRACIRIIARDCASDNRDKVTEKKRDYERGRMLTLAPFGFDTELALVAKNKASST